MKTSIQELVKQEKRAYFKEWREKNPDKVKRHNETYWKKRVLKRLKENGGQQ